MGIDEKVRNSEGPLSESVHMWLCVCRYVSANGRELQGLVAGNEQDTR